MVCALTLTAGHAQKKLPYRDATLPIEERVNDLLSRMTTEEKVGQLRCTLAWDYYETDGKKVVPSEKSGAPTAPTPGRGSRSRTV